MRWQAVTRDAGAGSVPRAAGLDPQCGHAMPGPASVGCFEVMLLPRFLSAEAPLVNGGHCDFTRKTLRMSRC